MDAEPVRCGRTDGKKWRCRLPVLPGQKYCERHVHRGRICSRKPVEVNKTFSKSKSKSTATSPLSSPKTTPTPQSHGKTDHNKVSLKNRSLKIKKRSMENAHRSLEFTTSAKGALQHGNDLGCGASSNDHKTSQSERCRRTDGRKWRCKKDVLPGLKYCMQHLHRGAKKVEKDQKSNQCLSFARYQQMRDNQNQSNDSRSSSESTTISM